MEINRYGEVLIVNEFWDCNCDNDYIHRKSEVECPVCNATPDEQPDSRLPEILVEFGDKLDRYERDELVYYLINHYVIPDSW
jgi:hypothetical protein